MRFTTILTALAASIPCTTAYWKGFNVGANNPDGSCKTTAQWTTAFQKIAGLPQHITSVRLYASSDCNTLANAVPAAIATGTQILVGVWAEDATHFTNEKNALQAAINAHGSNWIIAISVGSEDLYRGDTSASALAQQIYDIRGMVRAMGVQAQVGHVDTWTAWVDNNNKAVITASDFIGLDGYPYFQNAAIADASAVFWDSVTATRNQVNAVSPGKWVWVTETGWPNSTEDSVEANLDAQYILSIGYPVPINAYSTPGLGPLVPDLDQPEGPGQNEPYPDALTYLPAQPDRALPHTISTSYGEDEQSVPLAYRKKVCNMFGQLGARGVSVLFSSGDTGVSSACQTNDGKNTTRFLPIFPAACPSVTSVGGTYRVKPERAISFSSGGFSDTWPTPAYQQTAVRRYLNILGSRWQGLYNPGGRGFPDVAAQSYIFHVVDTQKEILVGGTSASSPAFAGVVALLNAYRLKAGKPVLGFLNPWIYSEGFKGLTDIVDGGSTGCPGKDIYSGLKTPFVPYASWNATPGWDPVTGYGTPNFPALLKLATKGPKGHW
nr:hypothetical protein B0A51_02560 [Rachicladosporium sp. CCFEE 5018]